MTACKTAVAVPGRLKLGQAGFVGFFLCVFNDSALHPTFSRAKCRRADLGGKRLPEAPALILSPYIGWTNPPAICRVCMISLCFYMDHF